MPALTAAIELRPAVQREADAIVLIGSGPIANKGAFIRESLAQRTVVGAYANQQIVGYMIWDRAFFGRPFVWLLGVELNFRRRGIAARLLGAFEQQCLGEDLFTSTNESNLPMHCVLARAGFVRSGQVDNLDPGDPEIFYHKPAARG